MIEKIVKLQFALFYQQPDFRPDTSYLQLNMDMGNLFDAMPQILSLPNDAPHDIPRVQMRSENNKYQCNMALSRIDFIINDITQDEDAWGEIVLDFKAKVALFIKSTISRSKINRFGLVGNFYIPDKNPSLTITRKHLKTDLQSAEEVNLRFNKRKSMHGLTLNNVTIINTTTPVNNPESDENGIFIELDVNNVPTENNISSETLMEIVGKLLPTFSPEQVKGLVK